EFNSDCRGRSIFRPLVNGKAMSTPQIPVDLPTYDELVGRDGIDDSNYNEHLYALIKPSALNTLTIHAEVEGIALLSLFEQFVERVRGAGFELTPMGRLLSRECILSTGGLMQQTIAGREGWVACQSSE